MPRRSSDNSNVVLTAEKATRHSRRVAYSVQAKIAFGWLWDFVFSAGGHVVEGCWSAMQVADVIYWTVRLAYRRRLPEVDVWWS